jgi:hypothetical protein
MRQKLASMTIDEICEHTFPLRISYSKKKAGRIRNRRSELRQNIESLLHPSPQAVNDAVAFANWLRENEYKPLHGNTNWIDFAGNYYNIEHLYELFLKQRNKSE